MWNCENFKKMSVDMRWNIATEQKLCFRCFSNGHHGEACSLEESLRVKWMSLSPSSDAS